MPVYQRGDLYVAEHAQDEQAIGRALRELDDRLILQKHPAEVEGGWVYKVFRHVSDWQPPVPIATWADAHGQPLPLTFGLVDLVNRLRPDSPGRTQDADLLNERHLADVERERERGRQDVIDEHAPTVARFRTTHSMHRSAKRSWQRNQHYPRWLREVLR